MTRRSATLPLLAAGVATVLSVAPAGAQEPGPVEVPAGPEPMPPTAPPTTLPPVEVPVEVPVEAPVGLPVRSGYAVDVPAKPVTELPLAPEGAPAPAAVPPPTPGPEHAPDRRPSRTPRPVPHDEPRAPAESPPAAATAGTSIPAAAPPPVPSRHTVVAGEHLWSIAAAQLAAATGRAPDIAEIAPYWTQLCMVNAPRLRSGDPDLVYPGEVLELPAV
jgi:hypothetical protein